jgi:hypothetical protein
VWETAGRPERGGLTVWKPFEQLDWDTQEAMLHAAGVALHLSATGEIAARGRLGSALALPRRHVYDGDAPAPPDPVATAWAEAVAQLEAAIEQARTDRQLLSLLTFGCRPSTGSRSNAPTCSASASPPSSCPAPANSAATISSDRRGRVMSRPGQHRRPYCRVPVDGRAAHAELGGDLRDGVTALAVLTAFLVHLPREGAPGADPASAFARRCDREPARRRCRPGCVRTSLLGQLGPAGELAGRLVDEDLAESGGGQDADARRVGRPARPAAACSTGESRVWIVDRGVRTNFSWRCGR